MRIPRFGRLPRNLRVRGRLSPAELADPGAGGARPPDSGRAWSAEIAWRRSGAPRFCVLAQADDEAGGTVLLESAPLPWPPSGPASVQALTDAVQALEASLRATGWTPLPPGQSWYARRFAWAPDTSLPAARAPRAAPLVESEPGEREQDLALFVRLPAWPTGTEKRWRCEIRWDAGWVDSRFEAVVRRPRSLRSRTLAVSAPLGSVLTGRPDAADEGDEDALLALCTALENAGWEPAGRGAPWYAHRFTWRRPGTPPDHVEPVTSAVSGKVGLARTGLW